MRKRLVGILLGTLLLAGVPGCRTVGVVAAFAGEVALDWAASKVEEPPCDCHDPFIHTGR
jgi:hypothetical protein